MATTSKIAATEGSGKNIATYSITEDTITKDIQRVVPSSSAGVELGNSTTPIQVSLANTATNATAVKVDNSAVTQPVTGSGTAGTAATGVVTVQGIASMVALKVDGSAVTQPVSGTVTANVTPTTSGGLHFYSGSIGATATSVKSSAGQIYGWYIGNSNTSAIYVQIFNVASGSVTLGTTTPDMSLYIPASGGANVSFAGGIAMGTAITVACTTTRTGSTAPASTVDLNIFYA